MAHLYGPAARCKLNLQNGSGSRADDRAGSRSALGCDIGRIKRAERQLEAKAASIILAAGFGVAGHAIRRAGKIRAAFNQACMLERSGHADRICAAVIRKPDFIAAGKGKRAWSCDET